MFLSIEFEREGFIIYSILQPESNKASPVIHNQMTLSAANKEGPNREADRFMGVQYILSRQTGRGSEIGRSALTDQIMQEETKFSDRYNSIEFDAYDMDLMKGYNRGDGHFIAIIPGRYVLRIKTEQVPIDTEYTVQFTAH